MIKKLFITVLIVVYYNSAFSQEIQKTDTIRNEKDLSQNLNELTSIIEKLNKINEEKLMLLDDYTDGVFDSKRVKVKKENILINDTIVATIKKQGNYYLISDNSRALFYKASVKNVTPKGRKTSQHWIELINGDNKVQELKLKSFNFSMESRVVNSLVHKGYIIKSGIEDRRYEKADNHITDQLDSILEQFEKAYATEDQIANDAKLVIQSGKNGVYEITADFVLIGYMIGKSVPDPKNSQRMRSEYYVYDAAKEPLAALWFNSFDTGDELKPKYIKTFSDEKDHAIITECKFYTLNKEPMANRMVKFLFANKYLKKKNKY